jgi:hypothetical protein
MADDEVQDFAGGCGAERRGAGITNRVTAQRFCTTCRI